MKKIILITLFLISCSTPKMSKRYPAGQVETEAAQKYAQEFSQFQSDIEEALVWREKSVNFYKAHAAEMKQKNQLSHVAMMQIFENDKKYLVIREKILSFVEKYRLPKGTLIFAPGEGTHSTQYVNRTDADSEPLTTYKIRIDPVDAEGRDLIMRLKIALAAATILYDNYLMGIYPYEKHRKTRRLLNRDMPEYKNQLEKVTDNFFDLGNRLEFLRSQILFRKSEAWDKENNIEITKNETYLNLLINQSQVYQFMKDGKNIQDQPNIVRAFADRIYDRGRFLVESFSYITSKQFGNTMGKVQFRDGLLKSLSTVEKHSITDNLQPLDIFLEKTPFRLTDKFIPGYYGHVAIWIGSKEQLQELGMWNDPLIAKYHQEIEQGHSIIEALRSGVEINTFDHFLDIDDLLIMRDNHLTLEQKREFIHRTFEQIGKEYDFNFDVETDNRIVCSEIVYVVFHNIQWPTQKSMGRYTISPDHVAQKGTTNGALTPIFIYRSGVKQTGDLSKILEDILNE